MWCSQTGRLLPALSLGMKVGDMLLQTPQRAALGSCSGPGSWQEHRECRLPSGHQDWGVRVPLRRLWGHPGLVTPQRQCVLPY